MIASTTPYPHGQVRVAVLALVWLLVLELLVAWRLTPPAVVSAEAPPSEFSGARAKQVLERLFDAQAPHPAGSPEQGRVRERLLQELALLGLQPEVQSGVACSADAICSELFNVVARLDGPGPWQGIALLAHYDSVPAGPGAGDDGQGVASLIEIARALRSAPPAGGVLLVFTDGEELGMLGAHLFADAHPLGAGVRVLLNLEARGNRGPSLMFETTPGSNWLVQRYQSAPHPVSSSLFAAVYRAMPNDTDLSVLSRRGAQGLNFAFVGGISDYHTPRDTLQRLDLRSVQQQGAAALATVRAIARAGVEGPGQEAVFFDVLGAFVLRLSTRWMSAVAALSSLLLGLALRREARRRPGYARELWRAALVLSSAWALPTLGAGVLGWLVQQTGALPFPIVAMPWPLLLGSWLLAAGGHAWVVSLARTETQRLAVWDATWSCWIVLGLLAVWLVPQASYLTLLPALTAAGTRAWLGPAPFHTRGALLMLATASLAALLWLPILSLLEPSIGLVAPSAVALAFAIGLSPFTPLLGPLLAGRRTAPILLAGGVLLALSQSFWPAYSAQVPQRLCLVYDVDTRGEARWLADAALGPLPDSLRAAAEFSLQPTQQHPWPGYGQGSMYAAAAPSLSGENLPYELTRSGRNSLRLVLQASEQLWAVGVRVQSPVRLEQVRWRGQAFAPRRSGEEQRLVIIPGSERVVALDLEFDGAPPAELELSEIVRGLPSGGDVLRAARGSAAVASGFGDLTLRRRSIDLEGSALRFP
jgi:peptidase M28-like protein